MADEYVEHSRQVYTGLEILSDFGGIVDIFMWVFIFMCTHFNDVQLDAKIIRSLYFTKNKDSKNMSSQVIVGEENLKGSHMGKFGLKPLKFSLSEKFQEFQIFKTLLRCLRKNRNLHNEILFLRGQQRLVSDFNVFNWI